MGDAASVIDELKRTGGEPLPKDFINQLLQATVRIRCNIAQLPGGSVRVRAGSGSLLGRYEAAGGDAVIMTNAHVIAKNESAGEYDCFAIFGEDTYYNVSVVRSVRESGLDFALLRLGSPVSKAAPVISYTDLGVGFCEFEDVSLNDYITILSYPGFAGPDKAVSEGRIADVYDGPIYEASALVDRELRRVAILNKKRCMLGMPTWKGWGAVGAFLYSILADDASISIGLRNTGPRIYENGTPSLRGNSKQSFSYICKFSYSLNISWN